MLAGRRRITLVEKEIDHFQDRCQARCAFAAGRHFERHARFCEGPLSANDPLRNRRLRRQERARDFLRRQAAQQPQRQGHARLHRQNRMSGDEDEPEKIVADVILEIGIFTSLTGLQVSG